MTSNRLAGSATCSLHHDLGGQRFPVPPLDGPPRVAEGGIVRQRLERAQLVEVARPTVADRVPSPAGSAPDSSA